MHFEATQDLAGALGVRLAWAPSIKDPGFDFHERIGRWPDAPGRYPDPAVRVLDPRFEDCRLPNAAVERIERHRARGDRVVLITGSVAPIVAPLAEHLRVSSVIAPRLAVEDGRLTGELEESPIAGEQKAEKMVEFAAGNGIDLSASVAYGDSADDLPMLERTGRAGVVNPRGRLLDQAVARNWEILYWEVADR